VAEQSHPANLIIPFFVDFCHRLSLRLSPLIEVGEQPPKVSIGRRLRAREFGDEAIIVRGSCARAACEKLM
jgi:hypothetical protein